MNRQQKVAQFKTKKTRLYGPKSLKELQVTVNGKPIREYIVPDAWARRM